MKRILITGANSYIGTSVEKYLNSFENEFEVTTIDMIDGTWRGFDFSKFDVVYHVAGIAHIKETKANYELYYNVNRDLAIETATKYKNSGVKQFVFLSSMSVYGVDTGVITKSTVPCPKTNYGKSKFQAEEEIRKLSDENFKVAILRPPMIYGKNCKGNFQSVVKLVKKFPFFPKLNNQRSMLYIDNLCAFMKLRIERELDGVFFPQNKEYLQTSSMAKAIAKGLNKKLFLSRIFGLCIYTLYPFSKKVRKAFGSLIYKDIEDLGFTYCNVNAEQGLFESI